MGHVRFKDFFIGDILTSAVRPLLDIIYIHNYFFFKETIVKQSIEEGSAWKNPSIIISSL